MRCCEKVKLCNNQVKNLKKGKDCYEKDINEFSKRANAAERRAAKAKEKLAKAEGLMKWKQQMKCCLALETEHATFFLGYNRHRHRNCIT